VNAPRAGWPPRLPGASAPPVVMAAANPGEDPPMVIKTYRGGTQGDAAQAMATDGPIFAEHGYIVSAQSWAAGGRTGAASLLVVAGVLCLVGGLLFFPLWALAVVFLVIGLVSGKGAGELTVTWAKR
jgi:hypothetical protein